jgi:hypothetical protein
MMDTLGAMGSGAAGLLGKFVPGLRMVGGLAAGLSAVQQVSRAMDAYETQQVGILQVGRQLDQQYGELDTTLATLARNPFFATAREVIPVLSAMGRVTGNVAAATEATRQAIRMGRAYGMAPEAAGNIMSQLTMYSPSGIATPQALVGTFEQARTRGELGRMSFGRYGEEVAQVAGVGGFGAATFAPEEYAAMTQTMAAFGGRYEANPGAAFGQYYARQHAPKSEIGQTLNYMAMADVMRQNPAGVRWGERMLQPRANWLHQQIMMSEGAHIPEYRAAQYARAMQMAGGNPVLGAQLYGQMTNAQDPAQSLIEFERLQQEAGQPGGIVGAYRARAAAAAPAGEAAIAAREASPYKPGQDILAREATAEELARTGAVKLLEDARTSMLKTIQDTAHAFNTTQSSAEALTTIFGDVWGAADKLKTVFLGLAAFFPSAAPMALTAAGAIQAAEWIHGLPPGTAAGINATPGFDFRGLFGPSFGPPASAPVPTQPRKSP